MTIYDKIRDEKLQYDINGEAAKIDKYEYLAGEKILPYDQRRVIKQTKFTYSPLEKAIEKMKYVNSNNRKKNSNQKI